jgi:hypothetical protein
MRNAALRLLVVGLVFLLGASAAQAASVILDPVLSSKAIGIENLDIDGALFDVAFTTRQSAESTYGPYPGPLFLFLPVTGKAAEIARVMDLINLELNLEGGITGVGSDAPLSGSYNNYFIGFQTRVDQSNNRDSIEAWDSGQTSAFWSKNTTPLLDYTDDLEAWAVLTPAGVPEPGTALLVSLGLAGLGAAGRRRREGSERTA